MKWASAISTQDSIEACIEEAAQSIKTQLAGQPADLTVVFVSPHFAEHYEKINCRFGSPSSVLNAVRDSDAFVRVSDQMEARQHPCPTSNLLDNSRMANRVLRHRAIPDGHSGASGVRRESHQPFQLGIDLPSQLFGRLTHAFPCLRSTEEAP